jgi:hypothetical protein
MAIPLRRYRSIAPPPLPMSEFTQPGIFAYIFRAAAARSFFPPGSHLPARFLPSTLSSTRDFAS